MAHKLQTSLIIMWCVSLFVSHNFSKNKPLQRASLWHCDSPHHWRYGWGWWMTTLYVRIHVPACSTFILVLQPCIITSKPQRNLQPEKWTSLSVSFISLPPISTIAHNFNTPSLPTLIPTLSIKSHAHRSHIKLFKMADNDHEELVDYDEEEVSPSSMAHR
jgi:hypothetical protein